MLHFSIKFHNEKKINLSNVSSVKGVEKDAEDFKFNLRSLGFGCATDFSVADKRVPK